MEQLQLSKQQLDNITLLDIMMNTMSAAEKLVFGKYEGKKYAHYDEENSVEWKTFDQLRRELQIQKECLQSMIKLFEKNSGNKNFSFPVNLSKEDIIKDLKILREEIKKHNPNNKIYSIYDDIIQLINNKACRNYSVNEIYSELNDKEASISDEGDMATEETVNNHVKNIMKANAQMEKRDKEAEKELMRNNGILNYTAILYEQKGRFKRHNYFKTLYQNYYNNTQ